jgi:hypothetical protein
MIGMRTSTSSTKDCNSKGVEQSIVMSKSLTTLCSSPLLTMPFFFFFFFWLYSNIVWLSDFNYRVSLLNEEVQEWVNTVSIWVNTVSIYKRTNGYVMLPSLLRLAGLPPLET